MVKRCILVPDNVPAILKLVNRWVIWRKGDTKPNGKFGKVPISRNGNNCNANDPSNWLTFDEAIALYAVGNCDGIGIVLADAPIDVDGQALYLVAIDLDDCADRQSEMKQLWKILGKPYIEESPSGKGLRMFAFSRFTIKGGNAGAGREMYGSGRYMTVTGVDAMGTLIDATEALLDLQSEWFPPKVKRQLNKTTISLMGSSYRPETPENIAHVKDQLRYLSADCHRHKWMKVVWSIQSTGWKCAIEIARTWSKSGTDRYTEEGFDNVVNSFDPEGGISPGTLDHMAREGGWLPAQAPLAVPMMGIHREATGVQPAARFDLLTYQDLKNRTPMQWRIKGVLPVRGLASIYGASGSGKSFLGIDAACSIACGLPAWFGFLIKQGPVVYVVLEGAAGIARRIEAWSLHYGLKVPNCLRIVTGNFTLTGDTDAVVLADEVLRVVGKGAVVIVDTLNQSAPSSDENSSMDMGIVLKNAKALSDVVDGLVLLVHHAGKDASKGMRGHSSLWAAMDAVIEVGRDKDGRRWRNAKQKDEADGAVFGFELAPHVLGIDDDGDDIRSCAVRPLPSSVSLGAKAPAKAPRGENQIAVLLAVQRATASGVPIQRSDAIRIGGQALDCEPGRRKARATSAIDSLVQLGQLQQIEGGFLKTKSPNPPVPDPPHRGIGEDGVRIAPKQHRNGDSVLWPGIDAPCGIENNSRQPPLNTLNGRLAPPIQ